MHGRVRTPLLLLAPALAVACASNPNERTLAELERVKPDVSDVQVENSIDQAMVGYRKFLDEAPESSLTPEAMRRLADLKLEKEYGILGGKGSTELPAPQAAMAPHEKPREQPRPTARTEPAAAATGFGPESDAEFERRAAGTARAKPSAKSAPLELPDGQSAAPSGPLDAIKLYDQILATYPHYPHADSVLYQKARALDELGRVDEAVAVMERLIDQYPDSRHIDEVQFRRGEYYFTRKKWLKAEDAYSAIRRIGAGTEYYPLALYKLGWTFYKQDMLDEALGEFTGLLDWAVANGHDLDHAKDEDEERRIADTYRVISLCFSNLGGPEVVQKYFAEHGARDYEDRLYAHLAEFYFDKRRYQDAAKTYDAFVALHPLHRSSPKFSMRVVEIYTAGNFPKLVLESKKAFAATYGLQSEYWRHFDVKESPEVLAYLKTNLQDLAGYYHTLYQNAELEDDKPANFDEAARWYRAYLASFPSDEGSPAINHRLADLLLEHQDFGEAAREYERTAYEYPEHAQAAAAGYAAIYAHREDQKRASGDAQAAIRRQAVDSTLKFVERFPAHEHAAKVLGAAVADLYDMKDYAAAIANARKLIDGYPQAELEVRRNAWAVVANASLDTADYAQAEQAYGRVLELTAADDPKRQAVFDDLAASIYKQGEQANAAGNFRAAADSFLRVAQAAPTSKIRPLAEYDASAALIHLSDWNGAAQVLESFQKEHPEHELHGDATKQLAYVYKQEGDSTRAADEYVRVAAQAKEPDARREALLVAGELYENANVTDRALAVYLDYVSQFPEPLETAVETRFKIAGIRKRKGDEKSYREELRQIVKLDGAAGSGRTPRIRFLAAQSALVLTDEYWRRFDEVKLVQPFEKNLKEKKRRMDAALDAYGGLVDYEVASVTAAATFYMAELYGQFGKALVDSERPAGLGPADLDEYAKALADEARPFQQRSLEIHEKNVELMASGLYDPWIEKSLARLAVLQPDRYAKFEARTGWLASIDRYSYEAPQVRAIAAPVPAPAPDAEVPAAAEKGDGDALAP
jgi:outer membrane protein assembly factor BamD (BamD/ComL family)